MREEFKKLLEKYQSEIKKAKEQISNAQVKVVTRVRGEVIIYSPGNIVFLKGKLGVVIKIRRDDKARDIARLIVKIVNTNKQDAVEHWYIPFIQFDESPADDETIIRRQEIVDNLFQKMKKSEFKNAPEDIKQELKEFYKKLCRGALLSSLPPSQFKIWVKREIEGFQTVNSLISGHIIKCY